MYVCKVCNVYIKFMYVMYRYRIYVKDELYALLVYVCYIILYTMNVHFLCNVCNIEMYICLYVCNA